jgi:hypothetical protein
LFRDLNLLQFRDFADLMLLKRTITPIAYKWTPQDLQARQLQYTRLATYFGAGGPGAWRQTPAAFDLHVRIVRILDGAEPWPADLPTEKDSREF